MIKNLLLVWKSIENCFKGYRLVWLAIACIGTALFTITGFDAWYFSIFNNTNTSQFFGLAGMIGFFTPVIIPAIFLIYGNIKNNAPVIRTGWLIGLTAFLGWGLSSFFKFFTGRVAPPHTIVTNLVDLSHQFQFGFYKGGIFWGWPSSHTSTAFAMAIFIAYTYRNKKWVVCVAIIFALYIGIGASMNFHWFSDFFAGIILGSVIGYSTYLTFSNK